MASFSKVSKERLITCDQRLQKICFEAIELMDFTVVCGHRDEEAQNDAVEKGLSKLKWPLSKHNTNPSRAVDLAPYGKKGIDWNDHASFYLLAGLIIGIGHKNGVKIRWGAYWNGLEGGKSKFVDMPHFEIIETLN